MNVKLFSHHDKDTALYYGYFDNSWVFSNMYPLTNFSNYNSVEQYIQAKKYTSSSSNSKKYRKIILAQTDPYIIRMLGNKKKDYVLRKNATIRGSKELVNDVIDEYEDVKIRKDWDKVKNKILLKALFYKFTLNDKLKDILLNQIKDNDLLVDHNDPQNVLGLMLTLLRYILKYGSCENISKEMSKNLRELLSKNKEYILL